MYQGAVLQGSTFDTVFSPSGSGSHLGALKARAGIGEDFGPTGEIEPGLRLKIGELDGDRHEVKESMKAANKQRGNRVRTARSKADRTMA